MKTLSSIIACIILFPLYAQAQFSYDPQKIQSVRWSPMPESVAGIGDFKIDLNGGWLFNPSPEKEFLQNGKLTGGKTIEVPGEWVMQGYAVKNYTYAGYSRSFTIPHNWKGKRILLKCEAVYSECKIWINNKPAGGHLGGMTPFETDITPLVIAGENCVSIAVRSESLADNLSFASRYAAHPLGGITRPIYLVALPDVNVASFHVQTTFDPRYEDAVLHAELKIANATTKDQQAEIKLILRDTSGKAIVATGKNIIKVSLTPGEIKKQTIDLNVANPKQWDTEHPNLYFLECGVTIDGKETSTVIRRFGFRQIDVRGNRVFVNNHPIKLKGVCRHESSLLRGRSLNDDQWAKDVKIFKEANVNYIRTSHYPPNEKLMDACDELGMFVEEEAPFCWANTENIPHYDKKMLEKDGEPFCWQTKDSLNSENYFEAILQPTLEMVERDKSHPCIIHWSIANESENFDEMFIMSADLIKAADPSRPRIFSNGGEEFMDDGYLEIGSVHYPGIDGVDTYHNSSRPVLLGEYCHVNAYNRVEQMTDPGVRDFWGSILLKMWDKMYASEGVLGGAIWNGIDDTFILPDGTMVGYGTWGPVDGWRRTRPEYWHLKKIYTPVKVTLQEGQPDDSVTLELENRYFFTNLDECRIVWENGGQTGEVHPDIKPGEKGSVKLPIFYSSLQKLSINIFYSSKAPVDQYVFDHSKPAITEKQEVTEPFQWSENGSVKIAESSQLKVRISSEKLIVSDHSGNEILDGWPVLMLIPFNSIGVSQMNEDTPDYGLCSPTATNRIIDAIVLNKEASSVLIVLKETYNEAVGTINLHLFADGRMELTYKYRMLISANLRQWGISFTLPEVMNILEWKRRGLWNVYPEDHIGRNSGIAQLFYGHPLCGQAGPAVLPSWSYNQDQTRFGSNDFRSTKRNILHASLRSEKGVGIEVASDGSQHIRCWLDRGSIHALIAEYDNPGSERFLRTRHAFKFDQPLMTGQDIRGTINLQILGAK